MSTGYSTISGLIFTAPNSYTSVRFNNMDINNAVDITETASHNSAPNRSMSIYKIARRDGEKLVSAYFARKEITISGYIQASSKDDLEVLIDNFKSQFQVISGNLDIDYANKTRRYQATFSELTIPRDPDNTDWCPFMVKFIVPSGKGQDVNFNNVNYLGITSSPYTGTFINLGSAEALPQITITVNTQTSLSAISLKGTAATPTLTITRTFSNSDVVVIDFSTYIVTVNGTAFNFTGAFPTWNSDSNTFVLTSTASARNLDVKFSYYPLYL